jgi:hypothetical protein
MKVYRFENANRQGPYHYSFQRQSTSYIYDWMRREHNNQTQPCPWDDQGMKSAWINLPGRKADEYIFGFASMEQLTSWFNPDEQAALTNMGAKLREFEVDPANVIIGEKQVAFIRPITALVHTENSGSLCQKLPALQDQWSELPKCG